jgi:protein with PEP-CTERM/exosortase system signal
MNKLKYLPILFTIAIAVSSAPLAQAISFNLTSDHMSGEGGAGTPPFGIVTLTQVGTSVEFNVTLFDDNTFVKTGAADFQYFKFNAIGVVVADITVTQNHSQGFALEAQTGAFNGDGTGNFAFGITAPAAGNGQNGETTNPILFSVANSTISDFTTPNADGNVFVVDMFSGQTGNTGPVDATTPNGVPDGGATVMLLGAALSALGMARRFLKC